MQKHDTIREELKELQSSLLAVHTPGHPFIVPEGYFESFPLKIMDLLSRERRGQPSLLEETGKTEDPFTVPEGYFDNLADNILKKIKAEADSVDDELQSISPVLANINRKAPFDVPEGYFRETAANIMAGIHAIDFVESELELLSPQLSGLRQKNIFQVPPGYFENFPAQILSLVRKPGRVVGGNFGSRFLRYASAAAVIGIIAVGAWIFSKNGNNASLATVDVTSDLDSSINRLSDVEIKNYINNNTITFPETNTASTDIAVDDIKDMLADVSDAEIRAYLNQNGISTDSQIN
jgi:hypothetical protein